MTAPIPRDRALLWPVLLLGVLGDLLFRAGELGLNVTLWLWLAAGLWYHHRRTDGAGVGPLEGRLLLGVVAVGFAWIWRASEMLRLLDTACLLVVAALLPLAAQAESWAGAGPPAPCPCSSTPSGMPPPRGADRRGCCSPWRGARCSPSRRCWCSVGS